MTAAQAQGGGHAHDLQTLIENLIEAKYAALAAAAKVQDGGTCNLDAPMLLCKRARATKRAIQAAGVGSGEFYARGGYVLSGGPGQGFRHTTYAEAFAAHLRTKGFTASVWYAID